MQRADVSELHFMTDIGNLESIQRLGILSHERARRIQHVSIADEDVQDLRDGKRVPVGRKLHEYANLYFDARNAMMYARRSKGPIVLRVSPDALDIKNSVIADGNAACLATRFFPSPAGLEQLNTERVFAKSWNDSDYWTKVERKRQRQAELLVPDVVPSSYIIGCYTRTATAQARCQELAVSLSVEVMPHVYFD